MVNNLKNRFLHLIVALILLVVVFSLPSFFEGNTVNLKQFNTQLNAKEKLATEMLEQLVAHSESELLHSFSKKYLNTDKNQGISFFIVEGDKTTFWTTRNIPFTNNTTSFNKNNGIILLKNGWYQYLVIKKNQKKYLALILIQKQSPINNKYFKNVFHPSFNIDVVAEITTYEGGNEVYSINNNFLFSIDNIDEAALPQNTDWLALILFFIALVLLISFVSKQTRQIKFIRKYSALITIGFILLLRVVLLYYDFFAVQLEMELFSPAIFAQSAFLPSLGQLLISALFFALLVYYFDKFIAKVNANSKSVALILVMLFSVLPLLLANLIEGLITNSKINFDINYVLDLSIYSFIGIGAIILILITLVLLLKTIFNHFINKAFKRGQLVTLLWIVNLIVVIVGHFFFGVTLFLTSWVLLVVLVFSFKTTSKTSFYRSAFLIFVIATTVSYGFIHLSKQKDQANKEFMAKKLSRERDPVAEYLFEGIESSIKQDTAVTNNITFYWERKSFIDAYLVNRYFGGFWKKYDVNVITACQQTDTILIEPDNINVNCLTFFNDKIEQESDNPFEANKSLSFLYSDEGVSSYLSKIKIESDSLSYYLFIELFPKNFSKTEGYPELLLDEKNTISKVNTNQYSYAKYKKGKLIDNIGKFNYSIELDKDFKFNSDGIYKTTYGDAYHAIYQSDKNTTIILSTPQKTIFNYVTTFSYFFIITSLLVLLVGFFFKISPFNWQIALTDFSTKIQLFIIVSIFLSFILFGWATTYYITKQNREKNKALLTEKVQSVLIELEQKLGVKNKLSSSMYDEMTYYLVKFSNVFYTDINLYSVDGSLLASSRPEIFSRGLIGEQMQPNAYRNIHFLKKSNYIQEENIGSLKYLSAYVPFRNNKNKILAYMNLPYFAKQNELDNELSSFYTALVNVYGLLFLITAIIAVFFANYISEPVRLIKNKISALQLGKSSELLEWQSNDEIGALVLEYNKKVLELERSAQKLIQSEKESAWREMAKQVAHEIKNPLTPMKLSIQQLERLAKSDSDDLSERIERTSKTLIEQIDTLTKIANEFSNFAKMPKANEEKINLVPIIETVIDLYQEEMKISFEDNSDGKATIIADKDQMSRVFNNLVKNAIQAIPEDVDGDIQVGVNVSDDEILVSISDNGAGIPEDKQSKIFVPNFTTKSTGMGLGLAMVKNIVENANGDIWFETKEGEGTTFFVKFIF